MKTTDPTEVVRGALSNHEAGWAGPTRNGEWSAKTLFQGIAVTVPSDRVDGPDELASSIRQGAGGICIASRFSGPADVKRSTGEAS
jgi:hypothetical protein